MTIDQLNARYGAPGRIVFRPGHCGYPNVVLANKYGTAEVALMGANVLSYRPTGHSEVLFRPSKRDYNRGESFHGGVPVCFPQFGNRFSKDLPQHGFARVMPFEVKATEYSDEMTEATLVLRSDAATRSLWPHDFELAIKVTVSMKLNIALTVTNADEKPFDFSCGLHPYLLLRERDEAVVRGLDGAAVHDAEADADGDPERNYASMVRIIRTSTEEAGWYFPWFVAKASYIDAQHPTYDSIRTVHQRLWDNGIALPGPDTDELRGDCRDTDGAGIHLSPKGLKAHGEMWAECVSGYLDEIL